VNDITLEFENKGIDVWWRLMYHSPDRGVVALGTGIVKVEDWDMFVEVFCNVHFIERR